LSSSPNRSSCPLRPSILPPSSPYESAVRSTSASIPNADDDAPSNTTSHQTTLSSMSPSTLILPTIVKRLRSNPDSTPPSSPMERTGVWARSSQDCSSPTTSPCTHQHKWSALIDASPTSSAYHTPTIPVASSKPQHGSKTIHTPAHYTLPSPSHHQTETTHCSNSKKPRFTWLVTSYLLPSPTPFGHHHKTGPGALLVC